MSVILKSDVFQILIYTSRFAALVVERERQHERETKKRKKSRERKRKRTRQ